MKLNINQVSYNVSSEGTGEPLVLLHGFTGSMADWEQLLPEWVSVFQVIRIDLLGHGQTGSPDSPNRYSMDQQILDLIGILDLLGIKQANVLGYSMGGRVALSLACLHPERIKCLILESVSPGLSNLKERQARRQHDQKLSRFISDEGMEAFVNFWENIPLFETQKKLPDALRDRVRSSRLANHPLGLAGSLLGMGTGSQPSWWNKLKRLKMPVLLVTGKKDQKFCRIASEMARLIKRCDWQIAEDCGHNIHLEDQMAFSRILRAFLRAKGVSQ
ncbi:MAG: 2-succinyl-6-hydroxy-2,4-cyclohexadiene-1-carboxylate synthase [Sporolactobacillus sp.]